MLLTQVDAKYSLVLKDYHANTRPSIRGKSRPRPSRLNYKAGQVGMDFLLLRMCWMGNFKRMQMYFYLRYKNLVLLSIYGDTDVLPS